MHCQWSHLLSIPLSLSIATSQSTASPDVQFTTCAVLDVSNCSFGATDVEDPVELWPRGPAPGCASAEKMSDDTSSCEHTTVWPFGAQKELSHVTARTYGHSSVQACTLSPEIVGL